ncbi:MAG: 16S rRNA (uracil(1498)-N(3))-methyltransferase [Lysobacterales bacterium]|jgi:16S rRNA (uracil1498-N3)-methyltransferase
MRRSRIYTSQPLLSADSVELQGAASHYLTRVLRLSKGDPLILFNGDGRDYSAEISEVQAKRVLTRLLDSTIPGNESPMKITLVQAICRGERMDYALQKATELGVFGIQPLISHRVEVRLDKARQAKRMKHWQRVVISACEQSGRAVVPEVKSPLSMFEWLAEADDSPRVVLDPFAENRLSGLSVEGDAISILVGPEGGFTQEEADAVRLSGLTAFSLGPRVLRTETAGPAAIAVLQAKTGEF